jgi:hypothetical protein
LLGMITVDRLEQFTNAYAPILVRELGRVTERRFVQLPFPVPFAVPSEPNWFVIDVMVLFDISNEPDRLVHNRKAKFPNVVRLIGENSSTPAPEQL